VSREGRGLFDFNMGFDFDMGFTAGNRAAAIGPRLLSLDFSGFSSFVKNQSLAIRF
jgi:hypothetical protein